MAEAVGNNTSLGLNAPTQQQAKSKYAGNSGSVRIMIKPQGELPDISVSSQQTQQQQQQPEQDSQQSAKSHMLDFLKRASDRVLDSHVNGSNQRRQNVHNSINEMGSRVTAQHQAMMQSMLSYSSLNNPLMANFAASYRSPTTYNPDTAPKSLVQDFTEGLYTDRITEKKHDRDNPNLEAQNFDAIAYNKLGENNTNSDSDFKIPAMSPQGTKTKDNWLKNMITKPFRPNEEKLKQQQTAPSAPPAPQTPESTPPNGQGSTTAIY
jgi:hypothetical protein